MTRHPRRFIAAACVGFAIALSSLSGAAYAATDTASGSKSCASGQVVYVRATLENSATMKFYQGSLLVYTAPAGRDHFHKYSSQSVNWKIYSTGNILSQTDGCMTAGGSLLGE